MTGTPSTGSALWDDYGYHHDDLVEPASMVPVSRQPRHAATNRAGDQGPEASSP